MKHLFLATTIAAVLFSTAAQAGERTIRIAVGELSCPSCVYIASTSMKAVPTVRVEGFQEGDNSWEGVFTVSYGDVSATPEMIVKAITDNGYPASVVTRGGS